MIIGTSDDFYPDAGARKEDSLSLACDRSADSHRADEAEREQSLCDRSHDVFLIILHSTRLVIEGVCLSLLTRYTGKRSTPIVHGVPVS